MTGTVDVLAQLLAPAAPPRWTQAVVTSVDAGAGTCTVVPARATSTATITVRYALPHPPRPGSTVWLQSTEGDTIAVAQQAPEGSPGCAVRRSTTLTLTTGVQTIVTGLDVVENDPWAMFDQTSLDRIIIPATGRYDLVGSASFDGSATGYRDLRLLVNGALANVVRGQNIGAADSLPLICAANDVVLAAGDYVQLSAYQNSGANLVIGAASYTPRLAVSWRGHKVPAATAGPELLTNPGFELGIGVGWSTWPWGTSAVWSDDTSTMHLGGHALKGVCAGAAVVAANSSGVAVQPGERYDISGWVKTGAALAGTSSEGVGLWLLAGPDESSADYFTPGVVVASGCPTDKATSTSWSRIAATVTIPAGCYFARLSLRSYSAAAHTVAWDDISMRKAATA